MREINSEIQILSKPAEVWRILMDLPTWSNWNPIVQKIGGKLEVGSRLSITMSDAKGNAGRSYKSTITAIEENKRFSFIAIMMAKILFSANRIIELADSQGGTLFIQREIYTGFMVPLFWKKLNTEALTMLNFMNAALKKEVENQKIANTY
jgi:hypothetical protein